MTITLKNMNSKFFFALASVAIGATGAAHAQNTTILPIGNANQVATDDLGRTLPTFAEVGAPKPNRTVGLFYWQWHVGLRHIPGQFDMVEYLKDKPYFKDFTAFPKDAPKHPTFYWAQPLFGYYRSNDAWVIRKHLTMLSDTGVDFLFLDYTNAQVYDKELKELMDVALDLKSQGVAVPRLVFFLNHEPDWKIEHLYKNWYQNPLYADMWFQWEGKPLLMSAKPKDDAPFKDKALIAPAQNFFTYRQTWAFHSKVKEPQKWRFMHGYNPPVALGPDGKPEQIAVAKSTGGPIWDNLRDGAVSAVEGKTYEEKDYAPDWTLPDRGQGIFFQNQWNKAEKDAPPIVLVTGWNEWTASVWNTPNVVMLGRKTVDGQGHIVDQFNPQFNRDLEPMTGDYRDNYYWQFIANMRRYKGMKPPLQPSAPRTVKIDGSFADWQPVSPEFQDTAHDVAKRDFDAQEPNIRYVNNTARNDFAGVKVTHDAKNVYFMARTVSSLSPSTGQNWMQLFIDSDRNAKTGWYGYDFLINRSHDGKNLSVERNLGNKWEWEKVGVAAGDWSGNQIELRIPRSLLGLTASSVTFDFKWADNALGEKPDAMDFYSNGDVAPNTRFNYRYMNG